MKKICIVLFCLLCQSGAMYITEANANIFELTDLCSKVPLKGYLSGAQVMSTQPASTPVEVYQNPADLQVIFKSSLGSLNIVVTNKWGYPVFQQTVNAIAGNSLNIATQSWAAGTYTISILNGQGGCLEGQFAK